MERRSCRLHLHLELEAKSISLFWENNPLIRVITISPWMSRLKITQKKRMEALCAKRSMYMCARTRASLCEWSRWKTIGTVICHGELNLATDQVCFLTGWAVIALIIDTASCWPREEIPIVSWVASSMWSWTPSLRSCPGAENLSQLQMMLSLNWEETGIFIIISDKGNRYYEHILFVYI